MTTDRNTPMKSTAWHRLNSSVLVLALVAALVVPLTPVRADEHDTQEASTVSEDESRLQALDGELTSIAERVPHVEAQLKTARAKQSETARELIAVREDIRRLRPGLEAARADYQRKQRLLAESIGTDYRSADPDAVELLATSGSVSDAMAKLKYSAVLEEHLDGLARDAEAAYGAMQERATTLETRQGSLELLERQLQSLGESIEAQRAELDELLANRSREAAYLQEKIVRAELVQGRLLDEAGGNAIWGSFSDGARVKQGEAIGFEGSTGFSTGCHTHFSVIKDGRWHNPATFWTMLRKPDGSFVQPYGWTAWAKQGVYGGNIHNGIDVVQGCGKPVRAAADGVVIRDIRSDGSGFGHYVMIRHAGGLITLYGHLL